MPQRTTCRICESACGLLATVQGGRVLSLEPDPEHPVSRGYACRKGTQFHETAQRTDRLVHPLIAGERATWDEALGFVGERVRGLLDQHGSDAVGLYSGNALGHSLGGVLGLAALQGALGTRKHYSCLTLDNSEMFAVADWVFGHPLTTFLADYEGSDCTVLFGTDPLSSQPSQAQSQPEGPRAIRANRAVLTVIDPRRSSTAAAAAHHLQPRVGTDLWILGWLVSRFVTDAHPTLLRAVQGFTLERASAVTGLASSSLTALEQRIRTAERPLIWAGLGVLLGPQGTLGWWLTLCLQALTGGIGEGRPWYPSPAGALRRVLSHVPLKGRDPTNVSRIGAWPAMLDSHPAATLPDDVLTPGAGQLRGLFVLGGEPLRALPDTQRAQAAFAALELLVVVGLFPTRASQQAHVFLPAATWLEREESGLHNLAQRPVAFARRDAPVVPPPGEARSDWSILTSIARATGRPAFGSWIADRACRLGSPEVLSRWTRWAGPAPRSPTARLEVPELCAALVRLEDPAPGLRLLTTVRPPTAMNHWIRPAREPGGRIHPDDLVAAGLSAGLVRVQGPAGAIEVELAADPTLARGTLELPFGGPLEPNRLIAADDLEPFSGQPLSNGTVVTLTAALSP